VRRVLILGGTAEARALAQVLVDQGYDVVSSLAGRVERPRLPVGDVHIGGFGGADGLSAWLREHKIATVVDATHPFAAQMTASAAEACARTGVPSLVLRRPGWREQPGDDWHRVPSLEAAAQALAAPMRVFLTTGRRSLPVFTPVPGVWFLARSVDPPSAPVPDNVRVLLGRGPYTVEGERDLIREHHLNTLVTKDSGGQLTTAKLTAARELGVQVIMVNRPPLPSGVHLADTVSEAAAWVQTCPFAR
jgi:precorrin-6A/cobalt-precorrin-6A reductase